MTKLSAIIAKRGACGVYAFEGSLDLGNLQKLAQQYGIGFFILDGGKARSKQEFLEHATSVFAFPDYFGKNWDAFADCLTDMSWIERDKYLIVYTESQHFAEGSPEEFATAIEIFKEAAEFWKKEQKTFLVLLHDTTGRQWDLPTMAL